MKSILLIIILFTAFLDIHAQYSLTGKQYVDSTKITPMEIGQNYYKGFGNTIRVYQQISDSILPKISVTDVNIMTWAVAYKNIIADVRTAFPYADLAVSKRYDILIGYNHLFVHDRLTNENHFRDFYTDTVKYHSGFILNDSLLYLSSIYNYHPLNAFPGAHMAIFNLRTNRFTKSIAIPFQGILLSHMINSWDLVQHEQIYLVHPLSGKLSRYNKNLEFIDSFHLDIPWQNKPKNLAYQNRTDSFVYRLYANLSQSMRLYGPDSIRNNRKLDPWHGLSGEFMDSVTRTARNHHEYIEKILAINDSTLLVSVCRPGYQLNFRDIYWYNISTRKVIAKNEHWTCSKQDSLSKPEDFFVVDPINSKPFMPYFYGNKIYSRAFYNPALFKSGPKREQSEIFYNDILKHNYRWRILEYTFSSR